MFKRSRSCSRDQGHVPEFKVIFNRSCSRDEGHVQRSKSCFRGPDHVQVVNVMFQISWFCSRGQGHVPEGQGHIFRGQSCFIGPDHVQEVNVMFQRSRSCSRDQSHVTEVKVMFQLLFKRLKSCTTGVKGIFSEISHVS